MSKAKEKKKEGAAEQASEPKLTPRMRTHYGDKAVPALMTRFGYKNVMQVPSASENLFEYSGGDFLFLGPRAAFKQEAEKIHGGGHGAQG